MSTRFDKIEETLSQGAVRKVRAKKAAEPPPPPPDDRDVWQKIAEEAYRNNLPYERFRKDATPEQKAARDAYQAESTRLHEQFKQDLFDYYDVTNNPRRDECFSVAWERGHSGGFNDVAACFSDIVPLIQPKPGAEAPLALTEDEEYAAFAALCTMVEDVHAVQDQMTDTQWKAAEALYRRLEARVNARQPAPRRRRQSAKTRS